MQGFSELLQVKFGDKLGTEGAEMLKRIVNGALRADELISDVRKPRRPDPTTLRPVDVAEVIHQLVSGTPEFQPPHLELTIASPLHQVLGHAARLSQCFSNLLWNAVKFVGPGVQPRVNVWSELMGNRVRIFVQDNGIGIPPGQGERIFGLFQRLHPDEAYQGTGVGLAIVRKAVERMNGKVGVDSTPGKGSRFWLELASIPA